MEIVIHTGSSYNWDTACQHFMKYNSQRPDITFLAIVVVIVAFRRHISWGSDIVVDAPVLSASFLAVSEVNDSWFHSISQKNILCFKVSMQVSMISNSLISFDDVFENL